MATNSVIGRSQAPRSVHAVQGRSGSSRFGFISVGAVGQQLTNIILFLMVLAWSSLRRLVATTWRGIASSVLRHCGEVTRRWNSSLRSHRTWRSQCRRVYSGLNKTLFAPVGPNSHGRGHQGANPAEPGPSPVEKRGLLGRLKAGRGHRRGGESSPK